MPFLRPLKVNRRLARLRDGHQRIASSLLGCNPFLFIGDDFEQQLSVFCTRHVIFQVLLVGLIVERLAGLGMELLPGITADCAIELDIGRVELRLARFQRGVETFD